MNIPFRVKVACLALAVNMPVLHFVTARDIADGTRVAPVRARVAGMISLSLWVVIVATDRWIGFTIRT